MNTHVDRISNLPTCITNNILANLSIRDAVRTSILSSQWRNKWTTIPRLVFEHHSAALLPHQTFTEENLINIINRVLHLHTGSIHTFKLSLHDLRGFRRIGRWIHLLSRRESLCEFVLKIWHIDEYYKVPSSLYFCQNLVHLELLNCTLSKPPSTFTGFTSLKTLYLQYITMVDDVFERLISNCPLLEKLRLRNFNGFTRLNIRAPNLLCLDIKGVFEEVNFESTFQLAEVYIKLDYMIDNSNNTVEYAKKDPCSSDTMVKFFSLLPSTLHRLELDNCFLKHLITGSNMLNKLSNSCMKLCYLSVHIDFEVQEECNAVLCLVNSFPNLKELNILVRPHLLVKEDNDDSYQDWEPFTRLRLITIGGAIWCGASVVNLIKFLLSNSPVLERMAIAPPNDIIGYNLLKELINFRQRASVVAKIVYVDPRHGSGTGSTGTGSDTSSEPDSELWQDEWELWQDEWELGQDVWEPWQLDAWNIG